jgi:hypothetical protein
MRCFILTRDVTPAKAGAHLEISGWIPAFAGMTPSVLMLFGAQND